MIINKYFVMHDLATFLCGEFYFRIEELGKETKIGATTRYLSPTKFSDPVSKNFNIFGQAKHIRSFLTLNCRRHPFNNEKALSVVLSNLKCLRVLSFCSSSNFAALPDSVDELIHFRYLDLSSTTLKKLPESLCNLYNLQTLRLQYCRQLTKLPNDMQNLVNLCHLDIREVGRDPYKNEKIK
jgi:Leucine-rich repeat (LRR) protein